MTINNQSLAPDLIDLTRAEDLTESQLKTTFQKANRDDEIVRKLKSSGAHLIEGARGVGKSTLLRRAEIELDESWQEDRVVGVYVNFKASLLLHNVENSSDYSPFICWVGAKIIEAFHEKCRKLSIINSSTIEERYKKSFGIDRAWNSEILGKIVTTLQKLSIEQSDQKVIDHKEFLASQHISEFSNPDGVSRFILHMIRDMNISRVVFLFDEAAHTFDETQQKSFFNFFKMLHGSSISVKAAVYPGITSYGGNFEVGHDAVRISLGAFEENTAKGRQELIQHFRALLQKRIKGKQFGALLDRGEALDLAILCSNGNPRTFLQIISKILDSQEISKRSALKAVTNYVYEELTEYHLGLKDRLPRFRSHIQLGMAFIKAHLVPELQKKNQGKGDLETQTIYFTIDDEIPYKVVKAIKLLEYSGAIFARSNVKTAGRRQARRYGLNLGFAAAEKVFDSAYSRDPDKAFKRLSTADYREFYRSDSRFNELVSDHPEQELCPNGHPRTSEGKFCPLCGEKFAQDPVISSLLDRSVNELSLSRFLKGKLTQDLGIQNVRRLLQANVQELQAVDLIGPVRSQQMLNAAEEFISG